MLNTTVKNTSEIKSKFPPLISSVTAIMPALQATKKFTKAWKYRFSAMIKQMGRSSMPLIRSHTDCFFIILSAWTIRWGIRTGLGLGMYFPGMGGMGLAWLSGTFRVGADSSHTSPMPISIESMMSEMHWASSLNRTVNSSCCFFSAWSECQSVRRSKALALPRKRRQPCTNSSALREPDPSSSMTDHSSCKSRSEISSLMAKSSIPRSESTSRRNSS
mmetsp:Transcript_40296/g.105851  ORF Transcript_40296/g.105851 Transcript_40296/m.105851 type:complete len:218 (+) Transcript_40296:1548-2201(+)